LGDHPVGWVRQDVRAIRKGSSHRLTQKKKKKKKKIPLLFLNFFLAQRTFHIARIDGDLAYTWSGVVTFVMLNSGGPLQPLLQALANGRALIIASNSCALHCAKVHAGDRY